MNAREIIARLKSGELPKNFNWNRDPFPDESSFPKAILTEPSPDQARRTTLLSECLRDGLHGVAHQPSAEERADYVGALQDLGILVDTVGIYSGRGNKVDATAKKLLALMRDQYPNVTPNVLTQATPEAIEWTAECKQIHPGLMSVAFMGSGNARLMAEGWTPDFVLEKLGWLVSTLVRDHHITVVGATEHTTQTPPDFLRRIVETQVDAGASYFCIADTIGTARPIGAHRITQFVRETLRRMGRDDVQIDWHGHRDKGNDEANAMAAAAAGADRIHVVARGIGERAGNTSMESVLLNLTSILEEAQEPSPWNLRLLSSVLDRYSRVTHVPVPTHGPLSQRAFKTSLGIHAAAMDKAHEAAEEARQLGMTQEAILLDQLYRTVYCAIDPEDVGRQHEIAVSPSSGAHNVRLAAELAGVNLASLSNEKIADVLDLAKNLERELTTEDLLKLLNGN